MNPSETITSHLEVSRVPIIIMQLQYLTTLAQIVIYYVSGLYSPNKLKTYPFYQFEHTVVTSAPPIHKANNDTTSRRIFGIRIR